MKSKIVILFCLACCSTVSAQPVAYTLQQLKDSALRNNIAVRAAQHDIDAARQQRRESLTKYFPNVSATGLWFNANKGMAEMDMNPSEMIPAELGASLSQVIPPQMLAALSSPMSISMMKNGTVGSVTAMQPVFAGGQIVNGNRLARVGEDVNRLQLQLSENEVEKKTEQYYWQLVSLKEKMRTVDAVDTLLSDLAKDVDVAVRAGVALRNDLLQVSLRRNDVQSQRLKLQNAMQLVRLTLAQYCGLNIAPGAFSVGMDDHVFDVVVPDMKQPGGMLPAWVSAESGVRLTPEYKLLEKQVEATSLQHKLEVGKQLPSVAVGAGYTYHNLMEKDHHFGMIFATVSVPISNWWGGSHAIKRRRIEQQKAEEQLADHNELLQIRVQKSWNDVQEADQQLQLSQRSVEQAAENLRLNRDYYKAGTSKMSDLLEAQLLYQQALDKRVDAFADYQNRLLDYRQAIGDN